MDGPQHKRVCFTLLTLYTFVTQPLREKSIYDTHISINRPQSPVRSKIFMSVCLDFALKKVSSWK